MQIIRYFILLMFFILPFLCRSQDLLNGDFEINNLTTCISGTSNAQFDTSMYGAISFGNFQGDNSVEVYHTDSCYNIIALDSFYIDTNTNNWVVGVLNSGGFYDAFSLELSSSLKRNSNYTLSFYAGTKSDIGSWQRKPIHLGISSTSTSLGDTLKTLHMDCDNKWIYFEFDFQTDLEEKYITIAAYDSNPNTWSYTLFDNFILTKNTTGVNEFKNKNISIYPNPFKDNISVETEENGIVKIVDIYGKEVFTQEVQKGKNNISLNNISSGIYIIDINGIKQKIIKN